MPRRSPARAPGLPRPARGCCWRGRRCQAMDAAAGPRAPARHWRCRGDRRHAHRVCRGRRGAGAGAIDQAEAMDAAAGTVQQLGAGEAVTPVDTRTRSAAANSGLVLARSIRPRRWMQPPDQGTSPALARSIRPRRCRGARRHAHQVRCGQLGTGDVAAIAGTRTRCAAASSGLVLARPAMPRRWMQPPDQGTSPALARSIRPRRWMQPPAPCSSSALAMLRRSSTRAPGALRPARHWRCCGDRRHAH